jgi:hypothetical protein
VSLKGIAHGMVWATGQCSCMPRCMHRFWLHTSTMMHASAIGHRGSAPLQACLHATPRASLGLGRAATASLEWHCAATPWCLCPRGPRAIPMKFPIRILVDLFAGVAGVLRMLGTHTGLSFESFTPTRVSISILQPPVSPRSGRAGAATHYLVMSTFIPKDSMSFSARLAACCISLGISCPRSFCRFGLIASEHSA